MQLEAITQFHIISTFFMVNIILSLKYKRKITHIKGGGVIERKKKNMI